MRWENGVFLMAHLFSKMPGESQYGSLLKWGYPNISLDGLFHGKSH
jgi:hypothetical protein